MYPMRPLCFQMSSWHHRQEQSGKSKQESLYLVHAMCHSMSPSCKKGKRIASGYRKHDAQEGMYRAERMRAVSLMHYFGRTFENYDLILEITDNL